MTEEYKYELIDKFLEERLSKDEAITFKEQLESDACFKADVKQQLDLQIALKAIYKTKKKIRPHKKPRIFKIERRQIILFASLAASIILLIFIGYAYNSFNKELNNTRMALQQKEDQQAALQDEIKKLQAEISWLSLRDSSGEHQAKLELEAKENQISKLKAQLSAKGVGPTNKERKQIAWAYLADKLIDPIEGDATSVRSSNAGFQKALELYYDKNYREANLLFEDLLEGVTGSLKADIMFFYGSSCLAVAKQFPAEKAVLEKAVTLFSAIIKNPSSPLYEEALWNLSITNLKMGRHKDCIALLEDIVNAKGYKYKEAEGLLQLLQ
nr:hypothetical protein [Bacteroidota bacterium]